MPNAEPGVLFPYQERPENLPMQFKVRFDQKVFLDLSRQGMQQLAQVLKEDSEKTYIEPGRESHERER